MSSLLPPIQPQSPLKRSQVASSSLPPEKGARRNSPGTAGATETEDELMQLDVVSTLDPSMIRWINKRKGGKADSGSNIKVALCK
jgi:hypothetical protein